MAFKFNWEHFKAPTPKKMKRIGNALVTLSTTIGTPTAFAGFVWWGLGIAALGVIGKIILTFWAEDDAVNKS